jgi:hypothetical protein
MKSFSKFLEEKYIQVNDIIDNCECDEQDDNTDNTDKPKKKKVLTKTKIFNQNLIKYLQQINSVQ